MNTRYFLSCPPEFRRNRSDPGGALRTLAACLLALPLVMMSMVPATAQQTQDPAAGQPQDAPAQPAPDVEVFGDWRLICRTVAQSDREVCLLIQDVVDQNSNRPILQVAVGLAGPERRHVAVVTVPLGVHLPTGISVSIDNKPLGKLPYRLCAINGCQTELPLTDEIMNSLRSGQGATVTFMDAAGQMVPVQVSLRGFTAGSAELK